jgi:phosphoribosylformylglycinamidine (FGAM) synthase-like amidotransferase family enzyme
MPGFLQTRGDWPEDMPEQKGNNPQSHGMIKKLVVFCGGFSCPDFTSGIAKARVFHPATWLKNPSFCPFLGQSPGIQFELRHKNILMHRHLKLPRNLE